MLQNDSCCEGFRQFQFKMEKKDNHSETVKADNAVHWGRWLLCFNSIDIGNINITERNASR